MLKPSQNVHLICLIILFLTGVLVGAAPVPQEEPPSMVFSSVLVGEVDDMPLYEIHFPGRKKPCYLVEGVMGGMAKGKSASLVCP